MLCTRDMHPQTTRFAFPTHVGFAIDRRGTGCGHIRQRLVRNILADEVRKRFNADSVLVRFKRTIEGRIEGTDTLGFRDLCLLADRLRKVLLKGNPARFWNGGQRILSSMLLLDDWFTFKTLQRVDASVSIERCGLSLEVHGMTAIDDVIFIYVSENESEFQRKNI